MEREQLQHRTKQFALRGIRLVESLPKGRTADVLGRQLLRSATSVGASYRAACRAKSTADFIAKMGIVEEETDESLYWMELLIEAGIVKAELLEALMKEADELLAMTSPPSIPPGNDANNPMWSAEFGMRNKNSFSFRTPHSEFRIHTGGGT